MMASAVFSRRRWPEEVDGFDISSSEGEEAHVLAVDDSLVDRKVIEKLLKISSYKVTAVDSGSRALKFLGLDEEEQNSTAVEELKVDLIITDYCMPGMTGYELLKKIKESSAFRDIPVVIMSSENILARIHRCLEEGADDFIVKPVKLSDVKRLKDRLKAKDCVSKIKTLDRTLINNKRKLSDGPDLSTSPTSSESPTSTISSPGSSPSISQSPASTPSPPPSSESSQSPPLEPPLEPLDSPSRKVKPSTDLDQIIPDSPL